MSARSSHLFWFIAQVALCSFNCHSREHSPAWFRLVHDGQKILEKTGEDMIVTGLQPHFMLDVEVISSWAIIRPGPGGVLLSLGGNALTQTWYHLAGFREGKDVQSVCVCMCNEHVQFVYGW